MNTYRRIYQRIRYGHNLITSNDITVKNDLSCDKIKNGVILNKNNPTQIIDDIDSELNINDGQIKGHNDRLWYFSEFGEEEEIHVKVMLGYMKESERLEKHIIQGSFRTYPKFV